MRGAPPFGVLAYCGLMFSDWVRTSLSCTPFCFRAACTFVIASAALERAVATEASVANSLLQATAHDFGAMVQQVCDLKLRTTAQRLGCYLLSLTETTGNDRAAFKLPFDKRLLAARLGCRQENLSRAFASLRQMGVETHGARVILHDIPKLRDYSEPDELLTFSRS